MLSLFIILLLCYALVSAKVEKTTLTAPILFTLAGILAFPFLSEMGNLPGRGAFLKLAEIGLVMLLFTDASRTDLQLLNHIRTLPARLLGIGLPLTILLGAVFAKLIFPSLSIWEAGILSAILAPTDAGLGQTIVTSPKLPLKVRQALNVEAGLNDGLAVPFLLFFIAMASPANDSEGLGIFLWEQLGLGVIEGIGIGLVGGWFLAFALRKNWMKKSYLQIAVVTLPALCVLISHAIGASMFIAAFVAGLAVQVPFKAAGKHSVEFTEEWGQILNFAVFFFFGWIVGKNFGALGWAPWLYSLASLTIVRILPVAISLKGTGLDRRTVLFIGWFGPRGLASIVLGLVYLEEMLLLSGETITRLAVIATVLLSIFAHGLTTAYGIRHLSDRSAL